MAALLKSSAYAKTAYGAGELPYPSPLFPQKSWKDLPTDLSSIGYTRVSTWEQNTARQLVGIPLDRVFEQKACGKNIDARHVLQEMLGFIRDGDELYVHSMDRLARNLKDLLSLASTSTRFLLGGRRLP